MKFLISLFLVSCIDPKVENLSKFKRCVAEIHRFEFIITHPRKKNYNYHICEIDPTSEMCFCHDIKPLPLKCFEIGMKLDYKIEIFENAVSQWESIIKDRKKHVEKNDKEIDETIKKMMNEDKYELEQLKKNRTFYDETCKKNRQLNKRN